MKRKLLFWVVLLVLFSWSFYRKGVNHGRHEAHGELDAFASKCFASGIGSVVMLPSTDGRKLYVLNETNWALAEAGYNDSVRAIVDIAVDEFLEKTS